MPSGSGTPSASRKRAASSTAMKRGSPATRTSSARRAFTSSSMLDAASTVRQRASSCSRVRSPRPSSMSWTPSALFAWY